jgi:DNA-binding NtrC family response regulator
MAKFKILLVDDEEEFVKSLAERLRIRNLDADTAFNGEQALSFVELQEPDVMVLDLRMPGIGGMEVLSQIKKNHPDIQVIILTGHGNKDHEDQALRLGAFGYLEKPVDIDKLVESMKQAYERKIIHNTMTVAA